VQQWHLADGQQSTRALSVEGRLNAHKLRRDDVPMIEDPPFANAHYPPQIHRGMLHALRGRLMSGLPQLRLSHSTAVYKAAGKNKFIVIPGD
jgi:hypothetical protein